MAFIVIINNKRKRSSAEGKFRTEA